VSNPQNRQRLGKGLEALIPKTALLSGKTITQIPVHLIKANPFQPRHHFDEASLQALSDSISQHGLTQPIVVRRVGEQYELIAGERRFRACLMAKMETIPAIIKAVTDKESLQLALIENLEREDLNPIEEAKGYIRLIEEFGHTHQEVSAIFSKSRSAVTNTLRLLHLPEPIQQAVSEGKLSEGHARTLLSLEDPTAILEAFAALQKQPMNVRQVEEWVAEKKEAQGTKKPKTNQLSLFPDIAKQLSEKLSTPIAVKGDENKGRIEIKYKSKDQLNTLLKLLGS